MWFEHLASLVLNRLLQAPPVPAAPGIILGTTTSAPHEAVVFANSHRAEHAVIVGKTGSGKTYLLESLALQLATKGEGFALFDFHGDVSLSLLGRLRPLDHASSRIVVLDPSHPTRSPGINILESGDSDAERFRRVSEISSILRQRWGVDSFGARTEELLRNSLYTLAGTGHTLADLPRLLSHADLRRELTRTLRHEEIAAYWTERYEPLSDAMKAVFREPLLNRVTAFLADPAVKHLLAQSRSTIDLTRAMAEGQWVVIRLPKGRLRENAHTLGNLLFAQLQFAALARESLPVSWRHTFTLLCDEVQNLAENDLSITITEGRKFGISVITANQFWDQLPKDLKGALLSAGTHIVFRVSSADAAVLGGELSIADRSRLTTQLTQLRRGEALVRQPSRSVVSLRVSRLPDARPLNAQELEALVLPVTMAREDVERLLQARRHPSVSDVQPSATDIEEGLHDW